MTKELISNIDKEIEHLIKEDPLRNWNRFFKQMNTKILNQYKKEGKYKLMANIQYTVGSLLSALTKLDKPKNFRDWDFDDTKGELYMGKESYYVGSVSFEEMKYVCEKIIRISENSTHTEETKKEV